MGTGVINNYSIEVVIQVGEIFQFPNQNSAKAPITKEVALREIKELSWEDIEAFSNLKANCLSRRPVEMNERVKEKLKKLDLIYDSGRSPIVVCMVMQSIVRDANDMLMVATR